MEKQRAKLNLPNYKESELASKVRTQDTFIQLGSEKLHHWIDEFEKAIKKINAGLL